MGALLKTAVGIVGRPSAALLLGTSLVILAASPAAAQSTVDLNIRLQRLERDIRDLQSATFKKPQGPLVDAPAQAAPAAPEPPKVDLEPVMRRIDELAQSVDHLTGQMEELGHQVDQLSQRTDRLQKQLDFQATQAAMRQAETADGAGAPVPPSAPEAGTLASATPAPNAPTSQPFSPGNGVLGTLPATRASQTPPAPAANPRVEFDSAMNLLSRAQYDKASQAFRAFADSHPDDERAPAALYWTGDIAYSTKKDYDEAARDFAELLKKYPNTPRAPEGMLKLGLSLFGLGQMKEGCAALAALPAKYPAASQEIAARARKERTDAKCR
jgi:tol-pal system protein YbgF